MIGGSRAVSSAGQSASLTPRKSGVRAPHRPPNPEHDDGPCRGSVHVRVRSPAGAWSRSGAWAAPPDEALLPPYRDTASTEAAGVSGSGVSNVRAAWPSAGLNSQSPGRRRHIRRSRSKPGQSSVMGHSSGMAERSTPDPNSVESRMAPPGGSITRGRFRPNASADPVLHRHDATNVRRRRCPSSERRSLPATDRRPPGLRGGGREQGRVQERDDRDGDHGDHEHDRAEDEQSEPSAWRTRLLPVCHRLSCGLDQAWDARGSRYGLTGCPSMPVRGSVARRRTIRARIERPTTSKPTSSMPAPTVATALSGPLDQK